MLKSNGSGGSARRTEKSAGLAQERNGPRESEKRGRRKGKWRAFSSALSLLRCGCFIPDLTRLPEAACEGTRQGVNSIRKGEKKGTQEKRFFPPKSGEIFLHFFEPPSSHWGRGNASISEPSGRTNPSSSRHSAAHFLTAPPVRAFLPTTLFTIPYFFPFSDPSVRPELEFCPDRGEGTLLRTPS